MKYDEGSTAHMVKRCALSPAGFEIPSHWREALPLPPSEPLQRQSRMRTLSTSQHRSLCKGRTCPQTPDTIRQGIEWNISDPLLMADQGMLNGHHYLSNFIDGSFDGFCVRTDVNRQDC
jgi:hypothetical protein